MRLIMEYDVSDDFTYWCTVTLPIEAESKLEALRELEHLVMEAACGDGYFEFCGHELSCDGFTQGRGEDLLFVDPQIMTIDEWFKTVEKNNGN